MPRPPPPSPACCRARIFKSAPRTGPCGGLRGPWRGCGALLEGGGVAAAAPAKGNGGGRAVGEPLPDALPHARGAAVVRLRLKIHARQSAGDRRRGGAVTGNPPAEA